MSIEQAIADNTAALRDLIAVLSKQSAVATVAPKQEKAKPEPKVEKAPEAPKVEAPAPQDAPPADAPIDFEAVKGPFLELCKVRGADAGRNLLSGFGVAKLSEIKPAEYGAALSAIQKVMAQ